MTGYCKWCGSLIPDKDMIRTYDGNHLEDTHRLKWVGCYPCYKKKFELAEYRLQQKIRDVRENDKKQS